MYSVLVNIKVHVFPGWLVDCEYTIIVSIIGNSELAIDVLQRQNVGDGLFIKLYFNISLYIVFSYIDVNYQVITLFSLR